MKKLLFVFLFLIMLCGSTLPIKTNYVYGEENKNFLEIKSESAYLMDYKTSTPIYSKNENERRPIASMCKVMTLLLTFDEIKSGKLSFDEEITVSENAASMGGSQVFLEPNKNYKVCDLIKSVIVSSANDSSYALAEKIAGSESAFVDKMNAKCLELGMENTKFSNCTGLPKPEQYSSAKDVAIMFSNLIKHKEYFKFSRIWLDKFYHSSDKFTEITNTNKMIRFYDGCDGGKTGYTSEAGHCLTATAKRGNLRLVSVVIKAPDSKTRFNDTAKLFNYGFSNFESKLIIDDKKPLNLTANIKNGKEEKISVKAEKPYFEFCKKGEKIALDIDYHIDDNLKAPVYEGQTVGKISIYKDSVLVKEINIVSLDSVLKKGFSDNLKSIAENWGI